MLAGSLEYSWTGSEEEGTQYRLQAESQQQHQQHQHHQQQQQLWMDQMVPLEALESAFDRAGGRWRQFSTPFAKNSNNNNTPVTCDKLRFVAEETWESILLEMGRVLEANNFLLPTLLPLSKVLTEPLEEEDKSEMPRLMRLLEIGLVAFHHIADAIPKKIKSQLETILLGTLMLQRQLVDLFNCQDRTSTPEVTAKAVARRSCVAAGIFYEDYFEQLRRVMKNIDSGFSENQLVRDAFSKLKFQAEGVYLTQQGATEAVDAIEREDSMGELTDLVALMRLTLASGDALQACQASLQRSVLKTQARMGSVSNLEQVIYGHLAMGGRRQDPTFSSFMGGGGSKEGVVARCHGAYTGTVDMVDSILSIPVTGQRGGGDAAAAPSGSVFLHRMLTRDMDRIREWIQKEWKSIDKRSTNDRGNGSGGSSEWRQMEIVVALLVKNLKDVELSERAESVVHQFLNSIRRLEGKIHELGTCILSVERQHGGGIPESEAEVEAGEEIDREEKAVAKGTQLPCGFLTERVRGTMTIAMEGATFARLTGSSEEMEAALEKVAKALGLWDEEHESVVKKVVVVSEEGEGWTMKATAATVGATAALAGLERAYEDRMIGDELDVELTELVPLVIVQIQALQACANIQRATSPSGSASE